jgi:hypothetical protein
MVTSAQWRCWDSAAGSHDGVGGDDLPERDPAITRRHVPMTDHVEAECGDASGDPLDQ